MRYPPGTFQNLLLSGAALLACVELVACGDFCFSGVINNPNGVIITTKNASPPPACPPSAIISRMNVAVVTSPICKTCTASSRAQHIFATLKSIQLHSVFSDPPNNPEWLELAPQFLREPRQIDLVGDSIPVILVQNAPVPAGTYREVRLQFLPDTTANAGALLTETSCGQNHSNCMFMADGRVEDLHFTGNGDSPELLLPLQYNGSSALAVVPGATVDLLFTLQPRQVSAVSPPEGWQIHYVLVGTASISR